MLQQQKIIVQRKYLIGGSKKISSPDVGMILARGNQTLIKKNAVVSA